MTRFGHTGACDEARLSGRLHVLRLDWTCSFRALGKCNLSVQDIARGHAIFAQTICTTLRTVNHPISVGLLPNATTEN